MYKHIKLRRRYWFMVVAAAVIVQHICGSGRSSSRSVCAIIILQFLCSISLFLLFASPFHCSPYTSTHSNFLWHINFLLQFFFCRIEAYPENRNVLVLHDVILEHA